MDATTRNHLEKGLKAVIIPSPQDPDLMTVVYIIDVPAKTPKDACHEAMKVMRAQLNYNDGGPAFTVINPKGTMWDVDYNEVGEDGEDGSVNKQ